MPSTEFSIISGVKWRRSKGCIILLSGRQNVSDRKTSTLIKSKTGLYFTQSVRLSLSVIAQSFFLLRSSLNIKDVSGYFSTNNLAISPVKYLITGVQADSYIATRALSLTV